MRHLPSSLRTLIVFEDSYGFYDPFPKRPVEVTWHNILDPSKGLSAVLASQTLNLHHVSLSFIVGAEELFRRCQPSWTWQYLQSLVLTSELLQDDWEKRDQLSALLLRASKFVQNMPSIHTFVIWNGGKSHACAFIYSVDKDGRSA